MMAALMAALVLVSIISGLLVRAGRNPLFPLARYRAWWTMVALYTLALLLDRRLSLLGFVLLSGLALSEFFKKMPAPPGRGVKAWCFAALILQYTWVYIDWYGLFIVFVPVYVFLYLPALYLRHRDTFHQVAVLQWGLMLTVFCLSHAAYILDLPRGPELLFFAVAVTELADAARILCGQTPLRKAAPVAAMTVAVGVGWLMGGVFTPMTPAHSLLAGLVIGVAACVGNACITATGEELSFTAGGSMERIESLAYTAPMFLHGYRYFYL